MRSQQEELQKELMEFKRDLVTQKQESLKQQETNKQKERLTKAFENVNMTPKIKESQNTFGASLGCYGSLPDYRTEFKPISMD